MAVATLPRSFVLSAASCNGVKYMQYEYEDVETHGFFKAVGGDIHSPFSKLEVVEAAAACNKGRVHIRCSYNMKYLAIRKEGDSVIAAVADEPVEDESAWSCTMFLPLQVPGSDTTGREIQLLHVQLGRNLFTDEISFLNVEAGGAAAAHREDSATRFVFSDLASLVIMPRFVAFKGDNGNYLSLSPTDRSYPHFRTPGLDIWHPYVLHEVLPSDGSGEVRIRFHDQDRFWRRTPQGLYAGFIIADEVANGGFFMPALVANNNDNLVVAFHTNHTTSSSVSRSYLRREHQSRIPGLNNTILATTASIDPQAHLVVEEAIRSRDIYNVIFNLVDARIRSGPPQSTNNHAFTNRTSLQQTMEHTFTVTESTTRTWNTTVSASARVTSTIKAGLPFITEASVEVSYEISGSFEWGEEVTVTTTREDKVIIDVPPMSYVRVSRLETRGTCDVPFSYTREDTLPTWERRVYQMHDGLYTGINGFNIHYEAIEEPLLTSTSTSTSTTNMPRVYQVIPVSSRVLPPPPNKSTCLTVESADQVSPT